MTTEALILDVDGTLADTEEAHRQSFNTAFEQMQLGWQWSAPTYRRLLAITGGKERIAAFIEEAQLPPAQRKALLARVPEIHALKTHVYTSTAREGGIALRTGVERLLDEARAAGLRLAIASTTTAANIDALLQAAWGARGLELFDVIACGDQVRHKKPAPDIYQLAMDALGLPPERCIAFEDSANGLASARAAGLWTVVTPTYWTEGSDFSGAGLLLPHLGDVQQPIAGEPGGQLQRAAWLGVQELQALACARDADRVQALYH